jgi:hypothetical protein
MLAQVSGAFVCVFGALRACVAPVALISSRLWCVRSGGHVSWSQGGQKFPAESPGQARESPRTGCSSGGFRVQKGGGLDACLRFAFWPGFLVCGLKVAGCYPYAVAVRD